MKAKAKVELAEDKSLRDITVKGYFCLHCGHKWIPRLQNRDTPPRICPNCKTAYWFRPPRQQQRRH